MTLNVDDWQALYSFAAVWVTFIATPVFLAGVYLDDWYFVAKKGKGQLPWHKRLKHPSISAAISWPIKHATFYTFWETTELTLGLASLYTYWQHLANTNIYGQFSEVIMGEFLALVLVMRLYNSALMVHTSNEIVHYTMGGLSCVFAFLQFSIPPQLFGFMISDLGGSTSVASPWIIIPLMVTTTLRLLWTLWVAYRYREFTGRPSDTGKSGGAPILKEKHRRDYDSLEELDDLSDVED